MMCESAPCRSQYGASLATQAQRRHFDFGLAFRTERVGTCPGQRPGKRTDTAPQIAYRLGGRPCLEGGSVTSSTSLGVRQTSANKTEDSFRSALNTALGGVWHEMRTHSAFSAGELCVRCKGEPEDLAHIVFRCPHWHKERRQVELPDDDVNTPPCVKLHGLLPAPRLPAIRTYEPALVNHVGVVTVWTDGSGRHSSDPQHRRCGVDYYTDTQERVFLPLPGIKQSVGLRLRERSDEEPRVRLPREPVAEEPKAPSRGMVFPEAPFQRGQHLRVTDWKSQGKVHLCLLDQTELQDVKEEKEEAVNWLYSSCGLPVRLLRLSLVEPRGVPQLLLLTVVGQVLTVPRLGVHPAVPVYPRRGCLGYRPPAKSGQFSGVVPENLTNVTLVVAWKKVRSLYLSKNIVAFQF
eukprot:3005891-Amphidinium_carterae.7